MKNESSDLVINAILGFSGVLVVLLLIGVITRVVFPRIENTREQGSSEFVGEIIQIEVLNGSGVSGLASSFTKKLRNSGFDVVESGNFETYDIQETLVIDRSGFIENAKRVANALGVKEKNIIQQLAPSYYLDATIVIGSDYKQLKLN
jgi:hypothetical protein